MSRIMGVAVAAVMSVCAFGGAAEASVIDFEGNGYTNEGVFTIGAKFDTNTKKGYFSTYSEEQNGSTYEFETTTLNGLNATLTSFNSRNVYSNGKLAETIIEAILYDAHAVQTFDSTDGTQNTYTGPQYFDAFFTINFDDFGQSYVTSQSGFGAGYYTATISPSVVPIPSSILLFGIALLTVAAVGRRVQYRPA